MKNFIGPAIAWMLGAAAPAHAYLIAPESAAPWANYTISWTNSGVNNCDGQSYSWAYRVTEHEMTGEGTRVRTFNISSPSTKSVTLRNSAGLYSYTVTVRYCSNSTFPKGAYTRDAGNADVSITTPTYYNYDALGRLKEVDDDYNGDRVYEYDAAGNRTRVTTQ